MEKKVIDLDHWVETYEHQRLPTKYWHYWGAALGLVIVLNVLSWSWWWWRWEQVQTIQQQRSATLSKIEETEHQLAIIKQEEINLDEYLDSRRKLVKDLKQDSPVLALYYQQILVLTEKTLPGNSVDKKVVFTVYDFDATHSRLSLKGTLNNKTDARGQAINEHKETLLADIIAAYNDSPYFEKAHLISFDNRKNLFEIELSLQFNVADAADQS